jgi:ABC-type uncharacterized transport system involved in gliding motility auxiliary subunit
MMHRGRDLIALLPLIGAAGLLLAVGRTLIEQRVDGWTYLLLAAGLACFVLFFIRRLRPLNTPLLVIARGAIFMALLLVLLASLNVVASHLTPRLDLTELRGYSLSEQTLNALEGLREPISISAFLRPTDYRSQVADKLLGEYAKRSPWISYEVINPDVRPSAMQQKGVSKYGTLVFEKTPKRLEINSVDEQSITSAILRLSDDDPRTVYFSTGHGERDLESAQRAGSRLLAWHLRNKTGYVLETVNFGTSGTLPDDVDVLVISSPRNPFPDQDVEVLEGYLERGGRLLVLLDAGLPNPFPELLDRWGVEVGENMVFDPGSSFFGDSATPLVSKYEPSLITRPLQGMNTFFPVAREVVPSDAMPEGLQAQSLVKTSDRSWAEVNMEDPQAYFDPAEDEPGPISLAVSVRSSLAAGRGAEAAKARLVVFGDSDFVSNAALSSTDADLGNALLLASAIDWLLEDDSLITLMATSTEKRRVILSGRQMRWIGYTTILLVPLTVALFGGVVWWRRRR